MIAIHDHDIENVCVLDDEPDFRSELEDVINDANMTAVSQTEPVESMEIFLSTIFENVDAVVTDHHLRKRGRYFPTDGAKLVSECYKRKKPSVLITRVEQPNLEIRKYRRNIPVIINPDDLSTELLIDSLGICIQEFKNQYSPHRKPWRTLIRIDEYDDELIYAFVSGWNAKEKISIYKSQLPFEIRNRLVPDLRLHAQVNVGAEKADELYFTNWESK